MKTRPLFLAIGTLTLSALTLPSDANPSQKAYYTAIAAETAGDVDTAKRAYEKALELNPRNAQARYRLGQLKINRDKIVAKAQERKISRVKIAEFRVEDAEFSDAVKALGIHIENATKDAEEQVLPNFIIQDPSNTLARSKVTLRMRHAPSGEILKHMLQMVNAKVRYDQHAVVIMPR